ncbi:hypothetical protein H5410_050976 [Solanum commersonii]|uniref:Uncharacterized protein n=1 Tax=Solanum commersonii TaxID=4109 RepID=A0A9J5WYM5_SOLCO|nr:hypothetical protein H5410_050976 [Solanum commersonii]
MSRQQQEQREMQMNVAKKSGKKITATPPQVDPQVPVNKKAIKQRQCINNSSLLATAGINPRFSK